MITIEISFLTYTCQLILEITFSCKYCVLVAKIILKLCLLFSTINCDSKLSCKCVVFLLVSAGHKLMFFKKGL